MKITKLKDAQKFKDNPFIIDGILVMKKGKTTVIAGSTKKVLMDAETGETEGIALLHRYKEVDKDQFIKLFLGEVKSLFDLSKAGLKAFGYILTCMKVNEDEIYVNINDMVKYSNWTTTGQAYRGLAELIANKIIAPSIRTNLWFINPNIIFNGDRIAFVKEYRLKKYKPAAKQGELFESPPPAPLGEQV